MKDLFRSEWRRFRRVSLIVGLVHGLALLFMSRVQDVPQLGYQDQAAMLIVYMLLGLVLAIVQVGSYRQTSRWLWLIHRPLAPSRIFGALALSALTVISTGIIAPLLLFLFATDTMTTQVVDIRHYVALLIVLAFTMMAWLAAAHASTSHNKAAVAVLLAPVMLALHLASVWWLMVPVLVCLMWLAFVALHSFRADRDAPIARSGVLLLTALPLQLGFFLLVFQLSKQGIAIVDVLGRSGPGRTVLSTDTSVDIEAMMRNMSQSFIAKGLHASRDARAAGWREQLPLVKLAGFQPEIDRFPVRHQLGNVAGPWFDDKRSIKWTFSHDRMQFRGRDALTGDARGWWGTSGIGSTGRFTEVPSSGMTRSVLYAIDGEMQRQHELVRLPDGEWFIARPQNALDHTILVTNRRVLAYRPERDAVSAFAPPRLDWEIQLEKGEDPPLQVDIAELLDGWLVSLFYSDAREFAGFESLIEPWQQVVHVDTEGQATVVGERRNIHDFGTSFAGAAAVPVASWWVSPPLYAFAHIPDVLDTGLIYPPRFEMLPDVPLFYPLTLVLMLASAVAGYFWLRGTQTRSSRRRLWLVTCALLGVPGFLSLICLEPRRGVVFRMPRISMRRSGLKAATL